MSCPMEKLLAVLPELDVSGGLAEEKAEEIKNQLKEMSWKMAEEAAAVQTHLETVQNLHQEAEKNLEKAKEEERAVFAELESKANALLATQEEVVSCQKELKALKDASCKEMLLGQELRESRDQAMQMKQEVFPCLLEGTWTSEGDKLEKLEQLKEHLKSVGTEKTLVAAVDGFGTCPETRGDFDKMAIQCIAEELALKLKQLEEQLFARQPAEKRMEAELAGLQALSEVSEERQKLAEEEHAKVDARIKDHKTQIKVCRLQLGRHAKALEKCREQIRRAEAEVAQIQEAVAAVDQLTLESLGEGMEVRRTASKAPVTPDKASAETSAEPATEPPLKRARTEEGKEQRRESQVASPARARPC